MIDAGLIAPDIVITLRDFALADLDERERARDLAATHPTLPNVEIWDVEEHFERRLIVRHNRPSITSLPKDPR